MMAVTLIRWLFTSLIGRLPEDRKAYYQEQLRRLLHEVTNAAVEGAIRGSTR